MPKVTETKHCVACGALTTFAAQQANNTFEVQDLPKKRGQTCDGWNGHPCRRTSTVLVTVTATEDERNPFRAADWGFDPDWDIWEKIG